MSVGVRSPSSPCRRAAAKLAPPTTEFRAGGTDVQERRRLALATGNLVDLTRVAGLSDIRIDEAGTHIGAMVTVQRLATETSLAGYPALQRSAGALATPQIRRQGTLGGNLAQQTRCTYFRNPSFTCARTGGDSCPAREGWHGMHVAFDDGPCIAPHVSTMAVALLTYDADVHVADGPDRGIESLYDGLADPSRDNSLETGELITSVSLPPAVAGERGAYVRAISRARAEWPLVEATARIVFATDGTIALARVAVGGVARRPLGLPHVGEALIGQLPDEAQLHAAACLASRGTNPLPGTRFKDELLRNTVLAALHEVVFG